MSDKDHCQNHPDNEVTARCVRFDRRFCDKEFEPETENPAECLSEGTYCEYRDQCMVWAKARRRRKKAKEAEANQSPCNV
jgi:hypothetical protein